MSSDRERDSNDPAQQYRSVVFQQGRVTLASDDNEAWDIARQTLAADVDDIVGPAGTPDNGYAISYPGKQGPADFTIGAGTMFLGGERLELRQDITYFGQKDGEWLDFPGPPANSAVESVWLLAWEQGLGAVEDPNLLEVALGGPDTAQRTRIVQRVMRSPVQSAGCAPAWNEVLASWQARGYDFDSRMRLLPYARLQVGFADAQPQPDPCEPATQGGYLGADNQFIRVMVSAADANAGTAKIVWAFDNATHLFKVVLQNDALTLKLSAPPVDAFHWPRAGQAVEVLRSAVRLADGHTMAQASGQIGSLVGDYNADQRTVQLTAALTDPPFTPGTVDPPLFLRLWEQQLDVKIGQPVTLGDTGLQVTLGAAGNHAIAPGVFWTFAVRPTTPQGVYPRRYLDAPQPPDGPRTWACPLATLQWAQEAATVTDCRDPFDNLVELTRHKNGCCEFTVGKRGSYPDLASALADIVARRLGSVGLCLLPEPAVHRLDQPVKIHHAPQLRLRITGSGPLTALEISGGGLDLQGLGALALESLHLRLMDEPSQWLVRHCDSLEVRRTRIERLFAVQTVPLLDSRSNRNVHIADSTFDAGYASFNHFVALVGAASPLAMPLFAVELLQDPPNEMLKRLTAVARLNAGDMATLLQSTKKIMSQQGFDKSPYAKAMIEWLRVVGQAGGATGDKLAAVAKELQVVLQQFLSIQSSQPGVGVVLDPVGDHWLSTSEFRCSVSISGTPGKRIDNFGSATRVFQAGIVITANSHVTHLAKCSFDMLTYGDSFVRFLAQKHVEGDPFHVPTSTVVEGCVFRQSPCFFFGYDVLMSSNSFTSRINIGAWVISRRFCPVANTGNEGPIQYLQTQNSLEPFVPINLIGLVAA